MTTVKQVLDNVSATQNAGADFTATKNKSIVTGSVIGMCAGFYIGYAKHMNMLATGLAGALAGAIIAGVMMPSATIK